MDLLSVLLLNYSLVLLINGILSAFCLYYYRDELYLYSLYLWIGTFLNVILQGAFQRTPMSMVLAFSTYYGVFLIQLKILNLATHLEFSRKKYSAIIAVSLTCSFVANWAQQTFTVIALPVATGLALVMFHSAMKVLFSPQTLASRVGAQIFSGLIIIHAIHLLDYPFLRNNPAFSALGFSFALILLITFSIFLPSFILKNVSDRYLKQLEELNLKLMEYQKKMGELMSLAQVGELSYSFVHDMASPTTLLMHYSSELLEMYGEGAPSGDKLLPCSKGIEKATTRLISLQKMFKAMIYNGTEKTLSQVDLREVVQNCIDLYSPFLARNEIEIGMTIGAADTVIDTLPGVVDRIILNLLQNAVNVLIDSSIRRISLSLEQGKDGGISILVRDTGPGIPPQRMAQLWERFGYSETANKSQDVNHKLRTGGSGFGLFKVKQLTHEIQGAIEVVESTSNGTIFKIDLPRNMSVEEERAAA